MHIYVYMYICTYAYTYICMHTLTYMTRTWGKVDDIGLSKSANVVANHVLKLRPHLQ